jgi:hypothetical protein
VDNAALPLGDMATAILEQIRKVKSDAKRSIKTPVTQATATIPAAMLAQSAAIASLSEDIKGAGNIEQLTLEARASTELTVSATLAPEADAA